MQKIILGGGGNDTAFLMEHNKDAVVVCVNYGQPAYKWEEEACRKLCGALGMQLMTLNISEVCTVTQFFIPNRNALLVSAVAAWYLGKRDEEIYIYLGIHHAREDLMCDCTDEWARAMNKTLELGTNGRAHLKTPYVSNGKKDILCSPRLRPLLYSCWKGVEGGCGECEKCKLLRQIQELS